MVEIAAEPDGTVSDIVSIAKVIAGYVVLIVQVDNSRMNEHRDDSTIFWEVEEVMDENAERLSQKNFFAK